MDRKVVSNFTNTNNATLDNLIGKSFYKFIGGGNFFSQFKDSFLEMNFLGGKKNRFIWGRRWFCVNVLSFFFPVDSPSPTPSGRSSAGP